MACSLLLQTGVIPFDCAFRLNFPRSGEDSPVNLSLQRAHFCEQPAASHPKIKQETCQRSNHVTRDTICYPVSRSTPAVICDARGYPSRLSSNAVNLSRPKAFESSRGGTHGLSFKGGVWKPLRNVGQCRASLRTEYAEGVSSQGGPAPDVGELEEQGAVEEESKESEWRIKLWCKSISLACWGKTQHLKRRTL